MSQKCKNENVNIIDSRDSNKLVSRIELSEV